WIDARDRRPDRGVRSLSPVPQLQIERPVAGVSIPEVEGDLLGVAVTQGAGMDVLHHADDLDRGGRVGAAAQTEARPDRAAIRKVSAREAFVDDRGPIRGR